MPSVAQLTAQTGQLEAQPAWQALTALAAEQGGLTLASLLSDSAPK